MSLNLNKSIIIIISVIFIVLVMPSNVFGLSERQVTTRNLAMFASLAYADLENIKGYNEQIVIDTNENDKLIQNFRFNRIDKIDENELTFKETKMVTDAELSSIKSSTTLLGIPLSDEEEDTYSYLFYGLASTNEVTDWEIVNYTKFRTTVIKGTAEFTAMTFKKGNDIVISYRGTDFDDIGDWTQDIMYGLIGYAGQENLAQDYAKIVAKHYIEENENINIYVTGHSLGGYLAQIGGAALVEENYIDNLKEIGYFNGMGLHFFSNIVSNLKVQNTKLQKYNISNSEYKQITDRESVLNRTQDKAKKALIYFKNRGGKLVSYHINGDIVSSLGTHIGEERGFDAYNVCINHHSGNKLLKDCITENGFKLIQKFLNKDISGYVDKYRPVWMLKYVWITHETDSFFGVLPHEDGTLPSRIEAEFNSPSTIKYRKTANATLTIKAVGGKLENDVITRNNFIVSNNERLQIVSVSKPKISKTSYGYEYKYTLVLKGKIVIGNSTITLKPNILKVKLNNQNEFVKNNILVSENIRTKLR